MPQRFAVGDAVAYQDGILGISLNCRVVKVMPSERGSGLYHIRDMAEKFERSVAGSTLRPIPSDDATEVFAIPAQALSS
jgi:hypothetical protein